MSPAQLRSVLSPSSEASEFDGKVLSVGDFLEPAESSPIDDRGGIVVLSKKLKKNTLYGILSVIIQVISTFEKCFI